MKKQYLFIILILGPWLVAAAQDKAGDRSPVASAEGSQTIGYLEPYRSIEMSSPEQGLIGSIHVKEGALVKAGEVLIELDNRVQRAQLKLAMAQAKSVARSQVAEADYELARENYNKLVRLNSSGSARGTEISRAPAALKSALGNLDLAKEEQNFAAIRVEQIKAEIERRTLVSPIDGVVLEINCDVSESANNQRSASSPGRDHVLIRVAQLDKLLLVIHLPAEAAHDITIGDQIPVRILLENSLNAHRGTDSLRPETVSPDEGIDVDGEIEFISPVIDPSSETIKTRIVIDNQDRKFKSGSHVHVTILKSRRKS